MMWSYVVCIFAISQAVIYTSLATAQVTIKAIPAASSVTLGTTIHLICQAQLCASEKVDYRWKCPNGPCSPSTSDAPGNIPRYMSISGNTLTVTVITESDAGLYTCTVSDDGGVSSSASYRLNVSGGLVAYTQPVGSPLMVHGSGKIITSMDGMGGGFSDMVITCRGPDNSRGVWKDANGIFLPAGFYQPMYQLKGNLLLKLSRSRRYQNGIFSCTRGQDSLSLGLYVKEGGIFLGKVVSGFKIIPTLARLEWKKMPGGIFQAQGYFVSFGRVDHDAKENLVIDDRSETSVILSNLQPGVKYEATIRAFGRSFGYNFITDQGPKATWTTPSAVKAPSACGPPPPVFTNCTESPCSLTVQWTQPSSLPTSPVTHYLLTLKQLGSSSPPLKTVVKDTEAKFALDTTKKSTVVVTLLSVDSLGMSSTVVTKTITVSAVVKAPLAPANLSATCLNSNVFLVEWIQPIQACTAPISHYVISYYPVNSAANFVEQIQVDGTTTSVFITLDPGLSDATEVMYKLKAVDSLGTESMPAQGTIMLFPPMGSLSLTLDQTTYELSVSWAMYEGLQYSCEVDGYVTMECTSSFVAAISDLINSTTVSVTSWKGSAKIETVTEVLPAVCKGSGIPGLGRKLIDESNIVVISWLLNGQVDEVMCKLNDEPPRNCSSPAMYDKTVLPSGKNTLEVTPFCQSIQLRSRTRSFISRSGIPANDSCAQMTVQNVSLLHSSESALYIDFSTSTPATCSCKVEGMTKPNGDAIRRDPCQRGSRVMDFKSLQRARSRPVKPIVVITCKSLDCGIKHRTQTSIDL